MDDEHHADAKEGSDIATAPAASLGTAEPASEAPGEKLLAKLPKGDAGTKIDALHQRHFQGTALAGNTEHWNLVHAFKEDVKKLFHELLAAVEKL